MRSTTYQFILDGKTPVACYDLIQWARWFESANRWVAVDYIPGGIRVSTVFLGLDHSFGGDRPLLFETMVFGGPLDSEQSRYESWDEAEEGHTQMVTRVIAATKREGK